MSKKLRAGDVLVGTCREDNSKKDIFVVAPSDDNEGEKALDLVCLTREIGWERLDGRWANVFDATGSSDKALSEFDCQGLGEEYSCYIFKRVKQIPKSLLSKKVNRDEE